MLFQLWHKKDGCQALSQPALCAAAAAACLDERSCCKRQQCQRLHLQGCRGKLAVTQLDSCPGSSQQRQRQSGKAQPAAVDYLTSEEPLLLLHAALISGNGPASAWKAASATSFRPCTAGPCCLSKHWRRSPHARCACAWQRGGHTTVFMLLHRVQPIALPCHRVWQA